MISYLKFNKLWKAIENDSLNLATYLQDVYWRSMLSESEMRRAAAFDCRCAKGEKLCRVSCCIRLPPILLFRHVRQRFARN